MANQQDLTNLASALQIDYLPGLKDILNNSNILMEKMKRNEEDFSGSHAYVALHYGRNEGVGARGEYGGTANLPSAQYQRVTNATFPMRYVYGRIQVTGPAMGHSKGNSYVAALDLEMRGMVRDLKRDANRMMFGNGTGLLATIAATGQADTTVFTVDSAQNLRANMAIEIAHATGGTAASTSNSISSISGTTITVGTACTVATDSVYGIYRYLTRNLEPYGIKNTCEDTDPTSPAGSGTNMHTDAWVTFGSLAKATYSWWAGIENGNSGTNRALTFDLMQETLDDIEVGGNGVTNLILCSHALKRKYASLLVHDKRYAGTGEVVLDGGYKALEYNQIPLVADRDCSHNRLYFLDLDSHILFQVEDWNWLDEDGAILARISGADAYEATLKKYYNVGSEGNSRNGLLDDITE